MVASSADDLADAVRALMVSVRHARRGNVQRAVEIASYVEQVRKCL